VDVPEFGFRNVCGGIAAGVVDKLQRFCVNIVACSGFSCSLFL